MTNEITRFTDDGNFRVTIRAWQRNAIVYNSFGSLVLIGGLAENVVARTGPWGLSAGPWGRAAGPWGAAAGPWGMEERLARGPWGRYHRATGPWGWQDVKWPWAPADSIHIRNEYRGPGGMFVRQVTFHDIASGTLLDWAIGPFLRLPNTGGDGFFRPTGLQTSVTVRFAERSVEDSVTVGRFPTA